MGNLPGGQVPLRSGSFRAIYMKNRQIPKAVILGFSDGANIAMRFAMKHPDMVTALILNGGNLDAKGVKRSTQLPIEIGYKIAKHFAKRSAEANKNAELLMELIQHIDTIHVMRKTVLLLDVVILPLMHTWLKIMLLIS